jgi:hypothetical protein
VFVIVSHFHLGLLFASKAKSLPLEWSVVGGFRRKHSSLLLGGINYGIKSFIELASGTKLQFVGHIEEKFESQY